MTHHSQLAALGANFEAPLDEFWDEIACNEMIIVYVPEAGQMKYLEALSLAVGRDLDAADQLHLDATQLHMEKTALAAAT